LPAEQGFQLPSAARVITLTTRRRTDTTCVSELPAHSGWPRARSLRGDQSLELLVARLPAVECSRRQLRRSAAKHEEGERSCERSGKHPSRKRPERRPRGIRGFGNLPIQGAQLLAEDIEFGLGIRDGGTRASAGGASSSKRPRLSGSEALFQTCRPLRDLGHRWIGYNRKVGRRDDVGQRASAICVTEHEGIGRRSQFRHGERSPCSAEVPSETRRSTRPSSSASASPSDHQFLGDGLLIAWRTIE
jgi:hypothetical protein